MKVFDLRCIQGHTFEGWFASENDFHEQCSRALVSCPVCGDVQIIRRPSAPRLNAKSNTRSHTAALEYNNAISHHNPDHSCANKTTQVNAAAKGAPVAGASQLPEQAVQKLWKQVVKHVIQNTEDVGNNFAEEARRIHYGEAKERGIRGQTTPEQALELQDEGIEVMALPLPVVSKEKLQ